MNPTLSLSLFPSVLRGPTDLSPQMTGEIKQPPGHEDYYSGLEVVETAPEVVDTSHLPEVSHGPEAGFAEHKQYSPPQALSHPYGQPHSPESVPPHSEQSFNGQHQYGGGGDPFKPTRDERILGLKKKVFWMVVALFGAGIVIGLAVGLGVGLGVTSSNSSRYVIVAPAVQPQALSSSLSVSLSRCLSPLETLHPSLASSWFSTMSLSRFSSPWIMRRVWSRQESAEGINAETQGWMDI